MYIVPKTALFECSVETQVHIFPVCSMVLSLYVVMIS